jgi:hypothetical protein
LARSLEKEADEEGMTTNAMANLILREYFDWTKKAREFGFVTVHKPIFTRLIESLDDETLARLGREVLFTTWKEMAEFWFQDSSPAKMLDVLSMRSKINPTKLRTRVTKEENTYTIVLRHDFGPRWSIIEKAALQELARKSFDSEPQISVGGTVVTARFRINSPKPPA